MPISPLEARRQAKLAVAEKTPVQTYIIQDEHFRPSAMGLGGVKTFIKNGKHCIALSPQQAQFYLDAGAIAPEPAPEEKK